MEEIRNPDQAFRDQLLDNYDDYYYSDPDINEAAIRSREEYRKETKYNDQIENLKRINDNKLMRERREREIIKEENERKKLIEIAERENEVNFVLSNIKKYVDLIQEINICAIVL